MLSGFIPLLRNFEIKDSATENFCLATYLPEELTHKSGTTFCLIEVEKGEGTVFRSGVPYEVTAPAFWVASPLDVYTFGGSEEWTLHAMVLNGRLFESIYTDLPGESPDGGGHGLDLCLYGV